MMKRYFRKIFDYGDLANVCRKALTIPQSLNFFSDKNFKCVNNWFKRSPFYSKFNIYLPDHPVPQ